MPQTLSPEETSFNFGSAQYRTFEPSETMDQFMAPSSAAGSSQHEPSPDAADPSETDQHVIVEDKRKRNTAASGKRHFRQFHSHRTDGLTCGALQRVSG